jgi:hypothetical protein
MENDAIEALECLKSWQRDGLITASMDDIKVIHEGILNALCEEDLEYLAIAHEIQLPSPTLLPSISRCSSMVSRLSSLTPPAQVP